MKKCHVCESIKEYALFSKANDTKDGYQRRCKECAKKYRDSHLDQAAAYRNNNKEELTQYFKDYYIKNSDYVKERVRSWQKKNPEKFKS